MQKTNKLSTRLLAMVMTVAMVCTMMSTTVFAEDGSTPGGVSLGTSGVIAVEINGESPAVVGTSLRDAIKKSGNDQVTSLRIIAGTVTQADWKYLRNLTALTTFEIDSAIADEDVDAMPTVTAGEQNSYVFPASIQSVAIPQVTSIDNYLFFYGGSALTTVSFPAATTIGMSAFANCGSLTTVNIPAATTIGAFAFMNCGSLATASFPAATTIGTSAFSGCAALATASFPVATTIDTGAFYGCAALATLKLGATVPTTVGADAFKDCPTIRGLDLVAADGNALTGEDLTNAQIAYKAVEDGKTDDNLWYGWTVAFAVTAKVTIDGKEETLKGDSLQAILESSKNNITDLKITSGKVTSDDWNYLTDLTAMTTFEIADGEAVTSVASIPDATQSATQYFSIFPKKIVTVTVPQQVTIGTRAFYQCSDLTTASLPKATSIGEMAFFGCTSLTTVSFPVVTSIMNGAFTDCEALETLPLGAVPPTVTGSPFTGGADPRALNFVAADGTPLTATTIPTLATAIASYKGVTKPGAVVDGKWYGWTIGATTTDNAITVAINGATTTVGGATLEAVVEANGGATAIISLKITAGKVTTKDWKYLKNLTAMTAFEIADDETIVVEAMPPVLPADLSSDIFPESIQSVTVPQVTLIGNYLFYRGYTALTTVNFPAATIIGEEAFSRCTALTSVNFPKATTINTGAFYGCAALTTLKLGATPPTTVGRGAFTNCPELRNLVLVAADGTTLLTGTALSTAQAAYKAYNDGNTTDNLWYGWAVGASTPTPTPTPPPAGDDGDSSSSSSSSSSGNLINNPVGNTGTNNAVADVVKNAAAAGKGSATSYINFTNYTALTVDGLKAINDAAAKAVEGTKIALNTAVQLDKTAGGVVTSRITLDPAKLAKVATGTIGLNLWFNQKNDTQVTSVNTLFAKHFDNKMVTISFEQKSPLAVNVELALKPDLSGLNTKNLYFYSYNPTTNVYNRIWAPNYWVDKNGYSHITAPFGGSIIVTDKALTAIK